MEEKLTVLMPKRVIENFKIYCNNISKIEKLMDNNDEYFSSYEEELTLMQSIDYYNMTLSQDGIDHYNNAISGNINEQGTVEKGLNQLISEYNQKIKNEKLDTIYIKKIDMLYKQILMPAEKKFSVDFISTDDEVRTILRETWDSFSADAQNILNVLKNKNATSGGNGIYIKGNKLHQLSYLLTEDHNKISNELISKEISEINEMLETPNLKPAMKKELEKRAELIQTLIVKRNYELTQLDTIFQEDSALVESAPKKTTMEIYCTKIENLIKESKLYYKILEGGGIFKNRKIKGNRHMNELLVDFFGSLTAIRENLSIILCEDENADISFYNEYEELYSAIKLSYKAENLIRNYLTKSLKDSAEEKQTCFGSPARFRTQWWNGEKKFARDHAAIIKKDDKYYYFILAGDAKNVEIIENKDSNVGFLTLKKGQSSFMIMPKILFTGHAAPFFKENSDAEEYILDDDSVTVPVKVSRQLYDIYIKGLFKKEAVNQGLISQEQYKHNIYLLIEKYLEFAHAYVQYQKFNFDIINDISKYNDIGEFYSDIDTCTSNLSWTMIDFSQIENLVESGDAYLFLIHNKYIYSGHAENHPYTKNLLAILSDENMLKTTMLLNSNPSVYFRPQTLEKKVTHKVGSILVNRRTEDGEPIPKDIYETIYKLKNGFSNISEDKYTEAEKYMSTHKVRCFKAKSDGYYRKNYMSDKYILELTYTKNNDISDRYNDMLNDRINKDIEDGFNIVSISRTTKDLVYCMVLDNNLKLIETKSLNIIDGINYYQLLQGTTHEKDIMKKTAWAYDISSADIKKAYIDLCITEIAKLAYKYNAIIAVENIRDNVKNKYAAIDNQVFRYFEERLAERLADLSFKSFQNGKAGSVSNPIQVSNNNNNSYQDGVIFYINGAYTRGIEPNTGFTSLFNFSLIKSITAKRQFLFKMKEIIYTGDSIKISFDYNDFQTSYNTDKTDWQIIIKGKASYFDKEKHCYIHIKDVVNDKIIPLAAGIDLDQNIAEQVLDRKVSGAFVEELFKWFRNSIIGTYVDKQGNQYYRSPIDGKTYEISDMIAYNLAKKLIFKLEYAGDSNSFTTEWLNYLAM